MLNLQRFTPHVEEGQVIEGTLTVAAGATAVLSDIPVVHAKRIDVIVKAAGNDIDASLKMYGAAKKADFTTSLGASVVAGNASGFKYEESIGQVCDLILQNNNGQGGAVDATYTVWIGARS